MLFFLTACRSAGWIAPRSCYFLLISALQIVGVGIIAKHFAGLDIIGHFLLTVLGITRIRPSIIHFRSTVRRFLISRDKIVNSYVYDISIDIVDKFLVTI